MSEIYHLLYVSEAPDSLNYSDLLDILKVARDFNEKNQISGVLIYRDGYFIQLLEGDKVKIDQLMNNIKKDARNHSLRILIESESSERIFGDWSMAFIDGDLSVNETSDLIDLFELATQFNHSQKELIMPMLKKFRQSLPIVSANN